MEYGAARNVSLKFVKSCNFGNAGEIKDVPHYIAAHLLEKQIAVAVEEAAVTGVKAHIYSLYMGNISQEMREQQQRVVARFLPPDMRFAQVFENYNNGLLGTHVHDHHYTDALERCIKNCPTDVVIFLDIDAIPLTPSAFDFLYEKAKQGILVGPAQRSLHIQNGRHIFVAVSAGALSKTAYAAAGSPAFRTTHRGDVAEEVTYRWQERGQPIYLLKPSHVEVPMWPYENDAVLEYGHGCTFDEMFYHEYESSGYTGKGEEHRLRFLKKCKQVLGE